MCMTILDAAQLDTVVGGIDKPNYGPFCASRAKAIERLEALMARGDEYADVIRSVNFYKGEMAAVGCPQS